MGTESVWGDSLRVEGGAVPGWRGILPSAGMGGGRPFWYEPVHGSAPDIAGKGTANPIGAILSVAMLLRHSLHRDDAAATFEAPVERALAAGVRTPDLGRPATAVQFGDPISAEVTRRPAVLPPARTP